MDEHTLKIIDCFENFLVYRQAEKGLLNSTIVNYKNDFKTFYKFISKEFVSELNEDDLINFLYYQMDNGNKANTIIRRISTIESFFTFLKEEYSLNNFSNCKLERPKVGKKLPEYLNNEESTGCLIF